MNWKNRSKGKNELIEFERGPVDEYGEEPGLPSLSTKQFLL